MFPLYRTFKHWKGMNYASSVRKKTITQLHHIFSHQTLEWRVDINSEGISVPMGLDIYLLSFGLLHSIILGKEDSAREKMHDVYFFACLIEVASTNQDSYIYWRILGSNEQTIVLYEQSLHNILRNPSDGHIWVADIIADWSKDIGWVNLAQRTYKMIIESCTPIMDEYDEYSSHTFSACTFFAADGI